MTHIIPKFFQFFILYALIFRCSSSVSPTVSTWKKSLACRLSQRLRTLPTGCLPISRVSTRSLKESSTLPARQNQVRHNICLLTRTRCVTTSVCSLEPGASHVCLLTRTRIVDLETTLFNNLYPLRVDCRPAWSSWGHWSNRTNGSYWGHRTFRPIWRHWIHWPSGTNWWNWYYWSTRRTG